MSVDVMAQVWKRAPYDGGTLLVLLALADWADDDGEGIFPTVKKLAAKSRQTPRSAQMNLKKLREDKVIVLVTEASGKRGLANEWKIDLERLQNFHPITEYSAAADRGKHKIETSVPETAESGQNVVDFTPDDPKQDGRNIFTPGPEADGRNIFTGENADSDGRSGLRGTGEVCDISPAPPNIDIHHISTITPTITGGREPAAVVEKEPPAFLRRHPPEFQRFVAAWPRDGEGPDEIYAAWRAVTKRPDIEDMLRAVELYRASVEAENATRPPDNQRPWCAATTWLKNRRWEGYLAKAELAAEMARSQPLQAAPWGMHPAGAKLLTELGAEKFNTWMRPCVLSMHEGQPVLTAPSRLIRDRLATEYIDQLERAFEKPVVLQ